MTNPLVGRSASVKRVIQAEHLKVFADLSGDHNPIHLDADYAAQTVFGRPIAHGMYVASFLSAVLANELPGRGSIYLEQNLRFTKPVFIGDEITAFVKVIEEIKPTIFRLETRCENQSGLEVITGTAVVKYAGAG